MRILSGAATTLLAAVVVLVGLEVSATAGTALKLTDRQLDKVTAGNTAIGSGTSVATGAQAATTVWIITTAGPGPEDAVAVGQVNAMGSSPSGATASATSVLSLSLSLGSAKP
jgi:hypothetical protein